MVSTPPFDIQPILMGDKVMLRALRDDDFDALYTVASDPDIWAMHPYRDRYQRKIFEGYFAEAMASKGAFAIIDKTTDAIIGSTRLSNFDAERSEIEIGWTFFPVSHWRGGYNRAVKALLLRYIFQHVEAVLFQIGAENLRSRTAVERLGAKFIGENTREHGGKVHDYVTYRLTAADAATGALALRVVNA